MLPYSSPFLSGQARRTQATRKYFYDQVPWEDAPLTLDLGCGNGTITLELALNTPYVTAIGIDIDPTLLSKAVKNSDHNAVHYLLADATTLPFRSNLFSFTLDHFTLMWIEKYRLALKEAYRTLRTGGLFASIEPDYNGRIEAPLRLSDTKPLAPPIIEYLHNLGANPYLGSQLPLALNKEGYKRIRFGVLAWEFNKPAAQKEIRGEANLLKAHGIPWTPPRFTFTPIFWVLGEKT
ncbi:MAG: class I SAM-dependent methyltransferase [Promethearchaeota archaeon]